MLRSAFECCDISRVESPLQKLLQFSREPWAETRGQKWECSLWHRSGRSAPFGVLPLGYRAFFCPRPVKLGSYPWLSPWTGGTSSALCNRCVMWFVASARGICTGDGAVALALVTPFLAPALALSEHAAELCPRPSEAVIHPLPSRTILLPYCRLCKKQ